MLWERWSNGPDTLDSPNGLLCRIQFELTDWVSNREEASRDKTNKFAWKKITTANDLASSLLFSRKRLKNTLLAYRASPNVYIVIVQTTAAW